MFRSSQLRILLFTFLNAFFSNFTAFSQNEGNIWYFGEFAGIDFNSGTPVVLSNSALNTWEGCATICDNSGNLLFYTDGISVWNNTHVPMPNGSGVLFGNPSSTQSAVIVQQPGSSTLYYIFTVDHIGGVDGLNYSKVDMSLQSGLGDITGPVNTPVIAPTSEKIAAIQHQNGTDYWIVTRLVNSDVYHSYLLDATGLSITPVVTTFSLNNSTCSIGYLKASLDGNKIASACWGEGNFLLYNFDASTGILSNPIDFQFTSTYGIEFSPNSELMYVSSIGVGIFQYDLLAGTALDIINSLQQISTLPSSCALQLGPDLKIYQARAAEPWLGVISDPNTLGAGCSYNPNGVALAPSTTSSLGLPTFHNIAVGGSTNISSCLGDSLILTDNYYSIHNWALASDPTIVISQDSSITIMPNSNITYLVHNNIDTTYFNIIVNSSTLFSLGNDTILCQGDSLILSPLSGQNTNFLWQDGNWSNSFTVLESGTYWAELTNEFGCVYRDSIDINFNGISVGSVSSVNESCIGANNGSATLTNITSFDGQSLTINWIDPSGNSLGPTTVTNGGNHTENDLYSGLWSLSITSSANCQWDTTIVISAGTSTTLSTNHSHPQCYGTSNGSITAFSGSPGTFNFVITNSVGAVVNSSGTNTANSLPSGIYSVSVTDNNGCGNETTIELIDPLPIQIELDLIHPRCYGFLTGVASVDSVLNAQGNYDAIYYGWDPNPNGQNGLNEISSTGLGAGEYVLEIVDDIGCSQDFVFHITQPNPLIGVTEVVSPTYCRTKGFQKGNGEVTVTTAGLDSSGTGNLFYTWYNLENGDISINTTFIVTEPGWMEVKIEDGNGCLFRDSLYVDSLTPIASFDLKSDQFEGPGEFEGTEDLDLHLINTSSNFAKPSYILSDTIFSYNFDSQVYPNNFGDWQFSYDYSEKLKVTYQGERDYQVCLVAKNFNDCRDTFCEIVKVHDFPELDIPNVFTPDKAPNQEFYFPNEGIETFECYVYNRYGVEVFKFNSIEDRWNGNNIKNNKPCADGVYFFTYNGKSTNRTIFNGQGNIHLIREK